MARGMEAESGWAEALSDVQPMFVIDAKMNREVLMDLLPMHEAWAGVRLEPVIAYGLRVYINGCKHLACTVARALRAKERAPSDGCGYITRLVARFTRRCVCCIRACVPQLHC